MNLKRNFKRILSGVMSVAMAATLLPSLPAVAEEAAEKYPYTMFAASDTEGSITINANNFCVNGNIKYLTFDEASYLAKVSRSMINKWADKGKFTVIKVGSRVRIRRDEFEDWMEQRDLERSIQ